MSPYSLKSINLNVFSINQSSTVPPSETEKLNSSAKTDDAPEGGQKLIRLWDTLKSFR